MSQTAKTAPLTESFVNLPANHHWLESVSQFEQIMTKTRAKSFPFYKDGQVLVAFTPFNQNGTYFVADDAFLQRLDEEVTDKTLRVYVRQGLANMANGKKIASEKGLTLSN